MIRLSVIASLAAVAAIALPAVAAAGPDPTRVSLGPHATYVSSQQINLDVRLSCPAGLTYYVGASVVQQQGFTEVYGYGSTQGVCTGRSQDVAVPIWAFSFPGWQLGNAVATVSACAFACDQAAREIRIDL